MRSTYDSSDPALDQALAEYLDRIDQGEAIDKLAFARERPAISEKLIQYFLNEREWKARQSPSDIMPPGVRIPQLPGNLTSDAEATVDHTPGRSRGLHIRCPHCSNGVELLADTPFEEITCRACGSTFNLAVRDEQTAAATALQQVGRFELVARLGIGGFGTVWKARDTELDRVVAVKIPRKGQLSTQELEQFFREARSAAQLRHPNIVPVYEVGKEGDTIFIVCAFVRGVSLADWLTGHRPDLTESCRICQTVARALEHAHEHGVIHRDLKPSNVMLDQAGVPHLMDFGLAKRDVHEITMTVDGQILGTPAYMSPEQAMGQAHWTDRRTDIYSLGVMLFEMVAGDKPFRGNAQMQVHQRLTEDAPDPRSLNRHIPRDLATICLKCLERDPNRRYGTAAAVADEIERFLNKMPIQARPISRTERLVRWCKRKPALAATVALTTFLAVAGPIAAFLISAQRDRLADLVTEKDGLILQMSAERQANIDRLSAAEAELKLATGQGNPWELWPARLDVGPLHQLLYEVHRTHFNSVAEEVARAGGAPLDQAYGHLGLAIISEQVGEVGKAREHYHEARDNFDRADRAAAEQPDVLLARARALVGISRLAGEEERPAADEALRAAGEIFKKLKRLQPGDFNFELRELDAELRSTVFAEPAVAREQLMKSAAKIKQLVDDWPTEPVEFYQMATLVVDSTSNRMVNTGVEPPAD